MKQMGVYSVRCAENGRVYIGSSSDLVVRLRRHRGDLKAGRHPCLEMQSDYTRFGAEAFSFKIIANCTEVERRDAERKYANEYSKNCYNKNIWKNYRRETHKRIHNSERTRP